MKDKLLNEEVINKIVDFYLYNEQLITNNEIKSIFNRINFIEEQIDYFKKNVPYFFQKDKLKQHNKRIELLKDIRNSLYNSLWIELEYMGKIL